ncbi:MAG: hypothetical protein ACYTJ0_03250 [Planctomycetota bacterium]|jgi:hypothetical protein
MSDDTRNAADRVRHILQAMERSIVTARRRRLNTGQEQQPDEPSKPAQPPTGTSDQQQQPAAPATPRLRARPKRPSGATSSFDEPPYHSQAG